MSSPTTGSQLRPTTKSSPKTGGLFRSGKQHPKWLGSNVPELKGEVFGSVTIMSSQIHRVNGSPYVKAHCSLSGVTKLVYLNNLKNGKTTSFLRNGRRPVPHSSVLGRRYDAILARCTNPTNPHWASYGGLGIKCLFKTRMEFVLWVSTNLPHPSYEGVEIDRKNNDGHYKPENLRLATRMQNTRNRRCSTYIQTAKGLVHILDWESPFSPTATYRRVKAGMSAEQILADAQRMVAARCKNWRSIVARLASTT